MCTNCVGVMTRISRWRMGAGRSRCDGRAKEALFRHAQCACWAARSCVLIARQERLAADGFRSCVSAIDVQIMFLKDY